MQNTLSITVHSMPKKMLSPFFWKNHLVFTVAPPIRGPTGSSPKPDDIGGGLWVVGVCALNAAARPEAR